LRLHAVRQILLDESSSLTLVVSALDSYSELCASVTGITPDACFEAWSEDSFLDSGVAINPRAAAHCVTDYRRSLVFIRSVHAALKKLLTERNTDVVNVLYAGCGPYATLLLPILAEFPAPRLRLQLLDIHQSALDAVHVMINHFGLNEYDIITQPADASTFRCSTAPQLIVAETMQKALEQEPQFPITANLAPQLAEGGIFIPERIDVDLCLSKAGKHQTLSRVLSLTTATGHAPPPVEVCLPKQTGLNSMAAELVTSIHVFGPYHLRPGEAEITLARPCQELSPLSAGASYRVEFCSGSYPVFEITAINKPGNKESS
jgi:hypothetical protein